MDHKKTLYSLFLTSALTSALPALATAQTAPPATPQAASSSIDDIVVTARRESEVLQDIPVSVQVVTGDRLQKLAITSVEEVSKLAPGLTLVNGGTTTSVTLRGVTWQPASGTPATPIYFNEVPFDPGNTIVSLFDVGQIEVLRGPQGTTRGAPSISGAVTIATRKPDVDQFGGYVQGLYGSGRHSDVQGAVNVPIIDGVLAVRLAANIEDSRANRITSVNSAIKPKFKDRTYRASLLFKPTDTLSIQAMYQRRKSYTRTFTQVAGPGSPGFAGFPGALPAIPANYNGPELTPGDRRAVQDLPDLSPQHIDLLTVNANWEVFGHNISVNYGRQFNRSGQQFNTYDYLNIVPGFEKPATFGNVGIPKFETREIRLSSLADPDRPFDYDIGWFSKHSNGIQYFDAPTYLSGAFGSPATAAPGDLVTPNPRYVLNSLTTIHLEQVFDSFYGNVRLHIGDRTELSGGLAIVRDRVQTDLDIQTDAAFNAFSNPALPSTAFCPFAVPGAIASPVYTAGVVCEVGLPAGIGNAVQNNNDRYTAALYNFSFSHKITDDLLVYATTGSSFRTGLPAINNPGLPEDLVTPAPEKAKSYEIGVKSSFGRHLTVNADVFQIDYGNQLTTFEGVSYYNTSTLQTSQTSYAFYRNVDARVRGFEVEISARPIDNLTLGVNASYSKIKSKGGLIPANPGGCEGAGPVGPENPINLCPSTKGQVLNTQPPFQATVNGGYEMPFTDALAGYFRFNVNFKGKNPNFGNFKSGTEFRSTPSFAIVDLFAGLTGNAGVWDLGVYAKNVFDKKNELSRVATINSIYTNFAAPAGYDVVRTTLPREIGVTLRYAFGSR
ncbi:hypothetical protein V474_02545 [Novosphingobium barchaimii LL02]|uniref:Uncharacterized protein n=1 Tax=Novosphingobium barchaimii LL02 TaxID=1114963 RepID=A0A0J7XJW6_9SPHN|nr:TonB-dependent receptor [Novosphingobium barchaimii]KMS51944.1 hypothetical protein V474_02545 [Novosphingobium barchaimii LL02]